MSIHRSDRVVVVGAGLGGLACALYLAAAGREVTVLEREPVPGGRAGRLELAGYAFDTGPTVLTAPELLAEPFAAVGERLADWLDLVRLDPAYRAHFPDGSTLDVHPDVERTAAEVAAVCGAREADGYRRFARWVGRLWRLQRDDFIARNLDSPRDLLRGNLLRLAATGGFRGLDARLGRFFQDPRTRRTFSFQAMYAGMSPFEARALYAVIAYLDCVGGVWYPRGGVHALPAALATAAVRHGVTIRYGCEVSAVEVRAGRAVAVRVAGGERVPAGAVVLNPDLPVAWRDLLPGPVPARLARLRYAPSCVVLHVGSRQHYSRIAHHNLHFGRAWRVTFDEVIRRGRLMSDPSLLVTNPSRTEPGMAPAGRHGYYVLAPVPNLAVGPRDWRSEGPRYAESLIGVLEARGYAGFGAGIEVSRLVTPADWAEVGLAAGTPFAAAHTFSQTGPFRPGTQHPGLPNVVFTGSGTQPGVGVPMVLLSGKLAAQRIAPS